MTRIVIVATWLAVAILIGGESVSFAQDASEPSDDEPTDVEATPEAEAPESPDEAEARTRFELGQQLYERGEFEEALEQFRAAHELSGRPGLLYNIYLAHRDAGNAREAATALRAYLEAEPDTSSRAMLDRRLASLEEQVAREDEAARRAREAEERAASVGDRNFTGPMVTLISGAVVLAAGSSLGLANRSLHDHISSRCYDGELCLSEERDDIESLDRRNLTADVLLGVGGAVMVAALIWIVVEATSGGGDDSGISLGCGVGGCAVRGTF